jgi:gliding motility-associated-like protein/uncharacterized repeat protein (TIGR01451 family)
VHKLTAIYGGILLCFVAVCFAQSAASQTVYIAPGGAVTLNASPINAPKYQWIKDGSPIINATNVSYIANTPGVYTVISYNLGGCASDVSSAITILTTDVIAKTADLTIDINSEAKTVSPNEVFDYSLRIYNNGPNDATSLIITDLLSDKLQLVELVVPLVGVAKYDMSTNTITWLIPKMTVGEIANLMFKVRAKTGGMVKNTANIVAAERDPKLFNNIALNMKQILEIKIPNVFTPNNDGKNDQFVIQGIGFYATNEITIINRWGSSVYEKKNYTNDWTADGLSDGTYFYVLRVKTESGEWQELKGYITVIH